MKQGKFRAFLSNYGEEAYHSRASRIIDQGVIVQDEIIRKLEYDINEIENKMDNLLDIAPESSISTAVKNVNVGDLVKAYHEHSVQRAILIQELAIARQTKVELFGNDDKEAKDV